MNGILHPQLLSDNGSTCTAGEPAEWLEEKVMDHVRRAKLHPRTEGKIEHRPDVSRHSILLANHSVTGDLEQQIGSSIASYSHLRFHVCICDLSGQTILLERESIGRDNIKNWLLRDGRRAAQH